MRSCRWLPTILLLIVISSGVASASQSPSDREAVRGAVLDYFEGWFTGDAERFLSALHPELAKRIPRERDGGWVLHSSDRESQTT